MIGTIIEGIYRITQGIYDVTGVVKYSSDGTVYTIPDSLMLICWCLLLEVHWFWTNLYTKIDFWYGKILGRTHRSVKESQIGTYEGIEVLLLECHTNGTSDGMVDCLLLGAWRGSLYWIKGSYNKYTELGFNYGKEPERGLGYAEITPVIMSYGIELVSCLCYNYMVEDWDLMGSSLRDSLRSIDISDLGWNDWNSIDSCDRIMI